MAIRQIAKIGEPVLRKKAKVVTKFDDKLVELLEDMADTMYEADGVGLAAPQVSILKRVVVIDIEDGEGARVFINPKITSTKGEHEVEEGCLSFPNEYAKVVRPKELTVEALDRDGKKFKLKAKDLLAQAVAHEVDHLDGIVFIDRMIPGTLEYVDNNQN